MICGIYSDDFFLFWLMNTRDQILDLILDRMMQTIELEVGV